MRKHDKVCLLIALALAAAAGFLCALFTVAVASFDSDPEEVLLEEYEDWPPVIEDYEGEDPYENERIEQAIIALPEKRYELTTDEFYLVCGIVAAESKGEPYAGMMAVAQTILNNCERNNSRPFDIAWMYATPDDTWSDEVWLAVTAVFFEGQTVTDETILWFYAPAICASEWHESQRFVMEIGGHRFFATHE